MRLLTLAFLFALPLFAGQSLHLTSGATASFTPPDSAPWTALGAFRGEMGVKINTCTSGKWFQLGAFIINCQSSNMLRITTGADEKLLDVTGRSEVLIRLQRDPDSALATTRSGTPQGHLEIWDADGTDYLAGTTLATSGGVDVSSIQSLTQTTSDIEIHWIKLYSTLTEKGQNAPLPNPHGTGDLANWEFEADLTDDGPDGLDFGATGHAFTTTATMNPVADPTVDADPYWMLQPSVRAGATVTLSAQRSISHDDVAGLTCVWSDQGGGSGPAAILFTGSTTACDTTAVFSTYGDYDLRLVVTDDSSNTGTADVTIGAVATDDNRIVVMDDDAFAFTLGDQIQWGQSVWPFLPKQTYKMAADFAAGRSSAGWETKGAGTVAVTNGSPTVTGSGTDFQDIYCSGGATPDDSAKFVITDDNGINWLNNISSCNSATSLTLGNNWNQASDDGLSYAVWTESNLFFWINGSENENYYDNVAAYYALCKTSGLQWACEEAAELAATWWSLPLLGEGYAVDGPTGGGGLMAPRLQDLIGVMLWAKEQGTEADVFPGIEHTIEFWDNIWVTHPGNYCVTDPREGWYVGMWLTLAAALDTDGARISNYESLLAAAMDASGGPSGGDIDPDICRYPNGGWHSYANMPTALTGTVSVTNGSPTVTCDSTCDWDSGDIGSYLQIGLVSIRDHVSDVGQYEIVAQDATTLTLGANFTGTTGSGRFYFIREGQNFFHQALGNAMPNLALDWQYKSGLTDHRQAIVDTFDYIAEKLYWADKKALYNLSDDAACAADQATETASGPCQYDPDSDASSKRFLSLEIAAAMAHAVKYGRQIDDSNTASRVALMDTLMGAALGGLGGPETDTTWAEEYNDNGATFTVGNGKQKNFGFCCGVGGAATWDAQRLGGLAAEALVSYSVPLSIGSVESATKASVTLYEPRGFSRTVDDQTGSAAAVTGDARQGPHLAVIEYKDAGDSVLETAYAMVGPSAEGVSASAVEIGGAATATGSFTVQ